MSRTLHPRSALTLATLALFGIVAPAASPATAAVVLNEFERTGTGTDRIEVYNTRPDTTIDLTGWYVQNQIGTVFALSGLLGPNAHSSFATIGSIVTDGGLIELYDGTLLLPRDSVPFGDQGGAPLPPPTGAYSCGRSPDGVSTGDAARDWNLDPSSTFAAANDHPVSALGMTPVFVNEAAQSFLRAGGLCGAPAVELYNPGPVPVNLTNWLLIDGRSVTPLFGFIPPGGFHVTTDFAPNFCFELSGVLYLFNQQGERVDQVGVHPVPLPGPSASYQRLPDGAVPFGPYDGFDFNSSGGGTTWFIQPRTLGQTNGPDPNSAAGDQVENTTWGRTKGRYR